MEESSIAAESAVVPKRQVVGRRRIHAGRPIIEMVVPGSKWVKHIKTRYNNQDLNYLQFGSKIHIYLHDELDPLKFVGKKIVAQAEIWEKQMDDGTRYLYVDLMPLKNQSTAPTHKMTLVVGPVPDRYRTSHFEVIDTPTKDQGGVVLSPLKASGS